MTSNTRPALRAWASIFGVVGILALPTVAKTCDIESTPEEVTVEEINAFFAGQSKTVVTFIGYSAAGYEDEGVMLETAARVLKAFDPRSTIVNVGGTPDGIGAVYPLASRNGFQTTGIVSIQAKVHGVEMAECVDVVFYVADETWGGFLEGSDRLSPTSAAMVENSDVLVGIGGGEVGRDELIAARRAGKEVRFYPADMNHEKAKDKARKKGLPEPTDFSGAAAAVF